MEETEKFCGLENFDLTVPEIRTKQRLDKYVFSFISNVSRNKIQTLIDSGMITVNGAAVKVNYRVSQNDVISVKIPRAEKKDILPENIDIDFVYQDKYLAVINKHAGLVVHPTYSTVDGTLVNALMHHFGDELSSVNGELRPGIVHRLDKDTTGLMVVAKNDIVHKPLSEQFAYKTALREYIGICIGRFKPGSGRIETYLKRWQKDRRIVVVSRYEGKKAVTNYETIEEFNKFSLVKFVLETGRTHQIRVHSKFLGHPLFGDRTYGGDNLKIIDLPKNQTQRLTRMLEYLNRQALHARKLEFYHPVLKERMSFECDLPEDMTETIKLIKQYGY